MILVAGLALYLPQAGHGQEGVPGVELAGVAGAHIEMLPGPGRTLLV